MTTFFAVIGLVISLMIIGFGIGVGIAIGLGIVMGISGDTLSVLLTWARTKHAEEAPHDH